MARQQLFVECASHFGDEDRVVVVLKRLMLGRVEAMHRMPSLVRQREHVIEHVGLVIHQDIRIAVERTATERAALLSLVWKAVAPAAVEPSLERSAILAAERFD